MRGLNDPVPVSGESGCKIHCTRRMRRHSCLPIRESGNLLSNPVHSFRGKRVARENPQMTLFAYVRRLLFLKGRHIFLRRRLYGSPVPSADYEALLG